MNSAESRSDSIAEVSRFVDLVRERYDEALRAFALEVDFCEREHVDAWMTTFTATRVDRAESLAAWRASGMVLRRWLLGELVMHARGTASCASAKEANACAGESRDSCNLAASRKPCDSCSSCDSCALGGCSTRARAANEALAFERYERAWGRSTLSHAHARVLVDLRAANNEDACEFFRRRFIERESLTTIANALGISTGNCRERARELDARLDSSVRALLASEGCACDESGASSIDDELAWLMEVTTR